MAVPPDNSGDQSKTMPPMRDVIDLLSTKMNSPPGENLTEDEKLARQLQQMEIAEAHGQSLHPLQHQSSHHSNVQRRTSPHSGTPIFQGSPSPQTYTQSPHLDAERFSQATSIQLAPNDHADLAPEALTPPMPWNRSPDGLKVVPQHIPWNSPEMAPEVVPPPIPLDPALSMPEAVVTPTLLERTSHLPPPSSDPSQLSLYLETYRQVPYPPQWLMPPVVQSLYASFIFVSPSEWIDTLESASWHSTRCGHARGRPPNPIFTFNFKARGGHFRDPKISWTMSSPLNPKKSLSRKHEWNYTLKLDLTTGIRSYEMLVTPDGKSVMTTYVHALNYDTLRFVGPDGKGYKWVTHGPVTTTRGARYDMLRHALFRSPDKNTDPLYGQIVADHAYWDGHIDRKEQHIGTTCLGCASSPLIGLRWKCRVCKEHNVCEGCSISKSSVQDTCDMIPISLPDEALHVRSETVDVGLVVATLQIVKEWEKITLKEERRTDPAGFKACVEGIRMGTLGRIGYWRSADFEGAGFEAPK